MHELSICLNLIKSLEEKAKRFSFSRIKTLWLEIGDLAGIEINAIQFSFPIAAANTIADQAILTIIPLAGMIFCESCQAKQALTSFALPCPKCGSYDYEIIQGKSLRILKMEVE